MPIHSLTKEKSLELKDLFQSKTKELEKVRNTDPSVMYENDLKQLLKKVK